MKKIILAASLIYSIPFMASAQSFQAGFSAYDKAYYGKLVKEGKTAGQGYAAPSSGYYSAVVGDRSSYTPAEIKNYIKDQDVKVLQEWQESVNAQVIKVLQSYRDLWVLEMSVEQLKASKADADIIKSVTDKLAKRQKAHDALLKTFTAQCKAPVL